MDFSTFTVGEQRALPKGNWAAEQREIYTAANEYCRETGCQFEFFGKDDKQNSGQHYIKRVR